MELVIEFWCRPEILLCLNLFGDELEFGIGEWVGLVGEMGMKLHLVDHIDYTS